MSETLRFLHRPSLKRAAMRNVVRTLLCVRRKNFRETLDEKKALIRVPLCAKCGRNCRCLNRTLRQLRDHLQVLAAAAGADLSFPLCHSTVDVERFLFPPATRHSSQSLPAMAGHLSLLQKPAPT